MFINEVVFSAYEVDKRLMIDEMMWDSTVFIYFIIFFLVSSFFSGGGGGVQGGRRSSIFASSNRMSCRENRGGRGGRGVGGFAAAVSERRCLARCGKLWRGGS